MYKDAAEEFYRCFMEKINQVLSTEGKDINVSGQCNLCFGFILIQFLCNYRRALT